MSTTPVNPGTVAPSTPVPNHPAVNAPVTSAASTPAKPKASERISALLTSLGTLAAELGPLFIHSVAGQNMLAESVVVLSVLSKEL